MILEFNSSQIGVRTSYLTEWEVLPLHHYGPETFKEIIFRNGKVAIDQQAVNDANTKGLQSSKNHAVSASQ